MEEESPGLGIHIITFLFVLAVVAVFVGVMVYPKYVYNNQYEEWTNTSGLHDDFGNGPVRFIEMTQDKQWVSDKYWLVRYDYLNFTIDRTTELRVVRPPDYGAFFPIAPEKMIYTDYPAGSYNLSWRHNDCVPTHIYFISGDIVEHTYIKQDCMCM